MLLYNDSFWLAESLRHFTATESRRSGQINVDRAETEISALELFAKRRYGKVIVDIEDMSDISEAESQRLTAFRNRIAALESLFIPEISPSAAARGEAPILLTAFYTPNWLKFHLTNILERSLEGIKFLWTEGELRLEFRMEELVDLIEALFADSEHRRKAIGDIRKGSVRR